MQNKRQLFLLRQTCFTFETTSIVLQFHRQRTFCYCPRCREQGNGMTRKLTNANFLCLGKRQRHFTRTKAGQFVLLSAGYFYLSSGFGVEHIATGLTVISILSVTINYRSILIVTALISTFCYFSYLLTYLLHGAESFSRS